MEDLTAFMRDCKELEEKDALEIYRLKSEINGLVKETNEIRKENENILNEIQGLLTSEANVFAEGGSILDQEQTLLHEITKTFTDLDVLNTSILSS